MFAGEHSDVLRASGWSKRQVKEFVIGNARRTVAHYKRAGRLDGAVTASDESTWRYVFDDPGDLLVVCAGGRAGSWSACLPGWGKKWTKAVTVEIA